MPPKAAVYRRAEDKASPQPKQTPSGAGSLPRILQDHVGGFFGDHDDRRIGVARDQIRHDRAVDHAKAFDYGTPFINIQPGFSNKANIFSLVADFVFYTAR